MTARSELGRRGPRTTFDIALYGVSQVLQGVVALVLMGIIARALGPGGFGEFSFLFVLASLLALVADFGLGPWITRAVAQEPGRRDSTLRLVLALRGRLLLLTLLLAFGIAVLYLQSWSRSIGFFAIATYTTLLGFIVVFESFLMGLRRVGRLSVGAVLGRLLELMAILLGVALGLVDSVLDVGIALGLGAFLRLALLVGLSRSFLSVGPEELAAGVQAPHRDLRSILREVVPFAAAAVLWTAYFRVDVLLLENLATPLALGLYTAANRLIEALLMIPRSIVGVLFPVFSAAWSESRLGPGLLERPTRAILLLAFGAAAGVWAVAGEIMVTLFGVGFEPGAVALRVLAFGLIPIFLNQLLGSVYSASHRQGEWSALLAGGLVVNVIANYLLIPRFSYAGTAWAKLATEAVLVIVLLTGLVRPHGSLFGIGWILRLCLASAGMAFAVERLNAPLALKAAAGAVLFLALVAAFRLFDREEWQQAVQSIRSGLGESRNRS